MQIKLTIPERLKDLRVERRLTLEQLAEATGLSKSALGKYETDEDKDISPYSIIALADFYKVSTDYLLGVTETKNHPNTDLHDLHLSDDMTTLLKSGKINNRLLCEMATHKNFQRLMMDMEIFVDRIADMRIRDTNAVLEATRRQVMEKYNPGVNDLYVRTLELAQISEDEYFSHVVHNDMDGIMRDIRDAHQKDTLTADAETPVAEVQKQLETAMSYEGSEEEKNARVYIASLGINYDTLTPEEFVTQINILKKSKHLKSSYNQRGKASPYQKHGKGKSRGCKR